MIVRNPQRTAFFRIQTSVPMDTTTHTASSHMKNTRTVLAYLALTAFALISNQLYSQCAIPVQGCAGVDLSAYGAGSGTNASLIEYDNFVAAYHSTLARTADGSFRVWGQVMANNGTSNVLSPLAINATNYTALTGTVLKGGIGSEGGGNTQGIVLTTTGLWAWGTEGAVIDPSLTASTTFQKLTIGGNTEGLPSGVTPGQVKMMFVTDETIAITTCDGAAYVISSRTNMNQGGTATTWTQVRTNAGGDPFITNVVAMRGGFSTLMALKNDGTLWTWGELSYLGDGSAVLARNRATQMTLPAGVTIKMFGATYDELNAPTQASQYLL